MIVILVTVVATLIVSSVGFLLCICFCTCCCSVEEKAADLEVPAPRPAKHDAGQAANSSRSREQPPESTGPSKTRFVIKVPGLGSFPIYGQVEPLSNTFRRPSPPKGKDSSGYKTRRKAGHANRALSPETDDEHYDGDGDFRDDVTTERFVRPPPPPSNLQPKPPTVSSKEFLQMQLEMSRIRANTYQCRNQVRQVNDGEVYRFENVQSY